MKQDNELGLRISAKALSSFETFKAHIEADDPKQKMIEAIVQSYGLAITSTKAKNGISAVSTLERIYDKYGQAVLDRTLRLAAATWEGENNSFSGNILMGIARIVVAYGDTVRDDVFKDHVYQLNYNTGRPIRLSFYHLL